MEEAQEPLADGRRLERRVDPCHDEPAEEERRVLGDRASHIACEPEASLVAIERLGVVGHAGELQRPARLRCAALEDLEHASRERVALTGGEEPFDPFRDPELVRGPDQERLPLLALRDR